MPKRRSSSQLPVQPSRDPATNVPLNAPGPALEAQLRTMAGYRSTDNQGSFPNADEMDELAQITSTDVYEGQLAAGATDDFLSDPDGDNLELLTELELRAGETDDPMQAVEEGMTYIPPIDPPIRPGGVDNAEIDNGLALDARDELDDDAAHRTFRNDDDALQAHVRDALLADSSTTQYADRITIGVHDGVVTLRGQVDDLMDSDNVLAVAEYVAGVAEVIDELRVRG